MAPEAGVINFHAHVCLGFVICWKGEVSMKKVGRKMKTMTVAVLVAFTAGRMATAKTQSTMEPFAAAGSSRQHLTGEGESLNVRNFGVQCDGTTDDYPAFEAALARAGSHVGTTVEFPPS